MLLPKIVETKERPVINSNYIPNKEFGAPRSINLHSLVYWIKRTPECIGIIKRVATDILSGVSFRAVEESKPSVGKAKKKWDQDAEEKALSYWEVNNGNQKIMGALIDWLMTGDAYIWKGKIKDVDLKENANKVFSRVGVSFDDNDLPKLKNELKQFLDEDRNAVSPFEVVPSSMMNINHDEYKIIKYIQKSKVNSLQNKKFDTDEIIHAKFMEIDGKVYGFSPMESSFYAIKTINAIQDYNYNYFANGAKIDRAWLIAGSMSTDTMDKLKEDLAQYKSVTNSRGDIIVETSADNIKIEKLNEIGEEMEFRKLAINAVGRLAFAFNMPADTLSAILGADVKGTALGSDIEDSGYNRNIAGAQKYWERLLNSQLFIPNFGVEIRLERTFRQDFIRKAQQMSQFVPVAEFMMKHEFPVNDEFYMDLFQIPNDYRVKGDLKKEILPDGPKPPQAGPPKGPAQTNYADAKAKQQSPQGPQVGA